MNYEFWWKLWNLVRARLLGLQPVRRRCCRKEENLKWLQLRKDLGFYKCQVCGSRHFELTVDPGKFGLKGAQL